MTGDETRGEAEASSSVDASSRTFKTEVTQGPCCHTWIEGADTCIACGAALTFESGRPSPEEMSDAEGDAWDALHDDTNIFCICDGCNFYSPAHDPERECSLNEHIEAIITARLLARRDAERDRARDAEVRRVVEGAAGPHDERVLYAARQLALNGISDRQRDVLLNGYPGVRSLVNTTLLTNLVRTVLHMTNDEAAARALTEIEEGSP